MHTGKNDVLDCASKPWRPARNCGEKWIWEVKIPMYMITRVIHRVKTGEMISAAGMLISPMPSRGISTFR